MERKQFTWYRSYYDALKELPAEEFRYIVLAVCAYALDGEETELSGVARAIFTLIRPTLEVGRSKAENRSRTEQTSISAEQTGNRPEQTKNKPEQTENKRKQTGNKPEQTRKEKEKEKEREKESENDSYCSPPPPSGPKRFVPPTLAEVQSYVAQRQSPVDPQGFIDFYASKGWMVGKTPMKDWKAACRNAETWERWSRTEASAPPKKGLAQALTDRQMEKYMGW
nr:MAG TPA_asm: hypothetical protein [Caudoviricetes sp.]